MTLQDRNKVRRRATHRSQGRTRVRRSLQGMRCARQRERGNRGAPSQGGGVCGEGLRGRLLEG